MTKLMHRGRGGSGMLPSVLDWADPPWASLFPFPPARSFRVEDYVEDGRYVLRAELPGLDPAKDISVTLDGDMLTVSAERHEEEKEEHRTEFRYGSLTRSVRLPAPVSEADVKARYDKGILEVSVPVPAGKPDAKKIEIQH
jgi:HSP20 family molecular chaperone IbpA